MIAVLYSYQFKVYRYHLNFISEYQVNAKSHPIQGKNKEEIYSCTYRKLRGEDVCRNMINKSNGFGWRPIFYATECKRVEIMELLLDNGAGTKL